MDYPTFEKTDAEATFDSPKTQTVADQNAPTIGMFELSLAPDAVILRGTVTDGLNPVTGAVVEVTSGDKTVEAVTNKSGVYSIVQGLAPGVATITVKCEKEDITDTITLEGGKVNQHDVTVPMADMRDHLKMF
ncbi:carboxypeptidase regulatory-like domain-containing protein [Hungatella hathewayi]|nr:carboxypeptidase regulatory-like domain-containing protein [Hungatella hathewayi]